jgi:hypothetical protein
VYVLVFNPKDVTSRAAFTKAQWMASGRASGSETTSDRLPVRAPGESDPNRQPGALERDQDRTKGDLSRSDPSRLERSDLPKSDKSDSSSVYSSTHSMTGKQVRISGTVLNKGGIKAIEVANIEDATGPAPTSPITPGATPKN